MQLVQLEGLRAWMCRDGGSHAAEPATPELLVALCHGYGAPGNDLAGLAEELWELQPRLRRALFVFPEAPLGMAEWDGRAWWPLNMAALQRAMGLNDFRPLMQEKPQGLDEAAQLLDHALQQVLDAERLPRTKLVVGGFSQGAMVTTHLTLQWCHTQQPPAGLVALSGMLLSSDEWTGWAGSGQKTAVYQSHGLSDVVLPFFAGEALRDVLKDAHWPVEFRSFSGGHGIPHHVLSDVGNFLVGRLPNA